LRLKKPCLRTGFFSEKVIFYKKTILFLIQKAGV